jgi:hypothetical protein
MLCESLTPKHRGDTLTGCHVLQTTNLDERLLGFTDADFQNTSSTSTKFDKPT